MVAALLLVAQILSPKDQGAIVEVITADLRAPGFVVGKGKFVLSADHVVGSDSTIKISDGTNPQRTGYLVLHDYTRDISLYRVDRPFERSLTVRSKQASTPFDASVVYRSGDKVQSTDVQVEGNELRGQGLYYTLKPSLPHQLAGAPVVNTKGEVVAIALGQDDTLNRALSAETLDQFLRHETTVEHSNKLGKLVQTTDSTRILAAPDVDSPTYYTAVPLQYFLATDYDDQFMQMELPNGVQGYVRKTMVRVVNPAVTLSSPGVANGYEVVRVVNTMTSSEFKATKSNADWLAECAHFVHQVFLSAGRDLSADLSVQMDIGKEVPTIDDLTIGDRIYFGNAKLARVAIYLGNDEYISVGKDGKLARSKFEGTAAKPYFKALH